MYEHQSGPTSLVPDHIIIVREVWWRRDLAHFEQSPRQAEIHSYNVYMMNKMRNQNYTCIGWLPQVDTSWSWFTRDIFASYDFLTQMCMMRVCENQSDY